MEDKMIKFKNLTVVTFLIFLMLVIVYSLFWGPVKKFTDSLMPAKVITVSAEGKAMASPDISKISFAVISEGVNPKTIAQENNKQMNTVIDFVKSQGVEEKDIKTIQYSLDPRYEYDDKNKKTFISGYVLTQTVLVKIRNLSKVPEIIAGLPEKGVNKVESISFEVDDPERYLAEARNQAFEKARKKAEEMAFKNNTKLGRVIDFSEWGPIMPRFDGLKSLGMGGGEISRSLPQIQPGTEEVILQVSVTYEIK